MHGLPLVHNDHEGKDRAHSYQDKAHIIKDGLNPAEIDSDRLPHDLGGHGRLGRANI